MPLVEVCELTKTYGPRVALSGLSFQVEQGETLALWGPNGAGKTTVLRCLLGLLPFSGRILLAGLDVARNGREVRRLTGFVPQDLALYPDMTVGELLGFISELRAAPKQEALAWTERFGLAELKARKVGELSGGMSQRLLLTLALVGNPPLLLLDEPTANLDEGAREAFLTLLRDLGREGRTVLISSHRLEDILSVAGRVLVLERGRLVAEGPPHRLLPRTQLHRLRGGAGEG